MSLNDDDLPNNTGRRVIAVTGGIGSGKSTVCELISKLYGKTVIFCDEIARSVANDQTVKDEIVKHFGVSSITPEGKLDRPYLRQVCFANKENTAKLNSVFQDRIYQILAERIKQSQDNAVFVEVSAPEQLRKEFFTDIWLVQAKDSLRIRRVSFRDNVREESIRAIMARQTIRFTPDEVIENNGYIDDLHAKLDELMAKIG